MTTSDMSAQYQALLEGEEQQQDEALAYVLRFLEVWEQEGHGTHSMTTIYDDKEWQPNAVGVLRPTPYPLTVMLIRDAIAAADARGMSRCYDAGIRARHA